MFSFFFFNDPATTEIYTLSLHDALPILAGENVAVPACETAVVLGAHVALFTVNRSEEHTSELQSRFDLVCRLLLEKKNNNNFLTLHQSHVVHRLTHPALLPHMHDPALAL